MYIELDDISEIRILRIKYISGSTWMDLLLILNLNYVLKFNNEVIAFIK